MITEFTKYLNYKNSLTKTALFIFFLAVISSVDLFTYSAPLNAILQQLLVFTLVIVIALIMFFVTKFKMGIQQVNPLNFLVTSLIIYMLIHPGTVIGWYLTYLLTAIFLAWGGKYIFRYNNLPIFNPAALGISGAYLLIMGLNMLGLIHIGENYPFIISWWGADLNELFLEGWPIASVIFSTILLGILIYLAQSFKKTTYIASIFMSYAIGLFLYNNLTVSMSFSVTNTVDFLSKGIFSSFAFLLLVMFPEPKSSPSFPKQQVVIGIAAGLLLLFINDVLPNSFNIGFELGSLLAILGINLLTLFIKSKKLLMR